MELLERECFLDRLHALLEETEEENGCTVLVTGEAGIGKTSLVERFTKQQEAARVLWGACEALFTPRPLGPLHDVAHQIHSPLRTLLDSEASRPSIFSAFLDELKGSSLPTILVFEDIHWADEATLDLIKYLGRRLHRSATMLILTYRDDEMGAHHPLRCVLGDFPNKAVTRLQLPPLSEAAVITLARRACRSAEGLHAATGGNPFFVTEVLASNNHGVPATVRDAVLARASRLSPEAREVLDLASAVPLRVEQWLMEVTLTPDPETIDACIASGLLRPDRSGLSFRHELARRAVEDSLSPARLQLLHAKVLKALQQRRAASVPTARIVHHAARAGDGPAVLQFAPIAAKQAASLGAHRQAQSHYATALRYADTLSPEEYAGLLEGFSYECYLTSQLTSQIEEALQARLTALDIWKQLHRQDKKGHNLRWLSRLSWILGKKADAENYAVQAVKILEGFPPSTELAMAYSNRAQLHMLAQENCEAVQWGHRAMALAEKLGDTETLAHALNNVGTAQLQTGDETGSLNLEKSLELALEHGYQEHAARAYTNLACRLVDSRDYAGAMRYLNDSITYCIELNLDSYSLYMLAWRARCHFEQGHWTEAAEDANSVLGKFCAITKIPALAVLAHVRIRRGDPEAMPLLDEARDLARSTGELQRIKPVAVARAEAAWLQGRSEDCFAEAKVGYELAVQHKSAWDLGELSFWMWRAGALAEPPPGAAEPFALQMAGDWQAAAELWHQIGCPYERALALMDGDEAAQREALSIFEQLGAAPAAEMVRRQLRRQGIRGIPRGPRPTTKKNPAGLTARQMEILTLIAEELQNAEIAHRLFISPKTVDHHISAILTKLDVHSRTEAVAAACQLGIISRATSNHGV
jgi:DNA-binding CsgD family transcriptional regulator